MSFYSFKIIQTTFFAIDKSFYQDIQIFETNIYICFIVQYFQEISSSEQQYS